jgi:hypothetical protein
MFLAGSMSKFDENLFGRIAVLSEYITPEQLQECLDSSREDGSKRHIGRLLLDRGYISREQFDRIVDIRRKKVRRLLRKPEEAQDTDREFGVLARQEGLIDLGILENAVLEQQRLKNLNLNCSLSEVLFASGSIDSEKILSILSKQGRRVLGCPVCDCHYRVIEFEDGRQYECSRCQSALAQPKFLDSLMVDAVLETEVDSKTDVSKTADRLTVES